MCQIDGEQRDTKIFRWQEALDFDSEGSRALVVEAGINLKAVETPSAQFLHLLLFQDKKPMGLILGEMVEPRLFQFFGFYSRSTDQRTVARDLFAFLCRLETPDVQELFTTTRPHHSLVNEILPEVGYELDYEKILVKRDLTDMEEVSTGDLEARCLGEFSRGLVLDTMLKSIQGNPLQAKKCKNPDGEFLALMDGVPPEEIDRFWKLYFLHGEVVGYSFPTLFDHDRTEGTVRFIGVLPEFQGRGFGRLIHAHSLWLLRGMGATTYLGSTEADNLPMKRIFFLNGCTESTRRRFYKKFQDTDRLADEILAVTG